ncbi:glycosyltransferase family 4 protein [Gillisia hiemivivida]|uniref:Glycosyltransferase n=1 Tax=Gillisia hiemivivida TaxID=291190 RepID=A0A5C6ZTZ8_9FLAO|nr:glycosyltransferase [Gillisia hiemivivida]TXD93901.1 glycosyltransferase [Gillisia hiemivivida]
MRFAVFTHVEHIKSANQIYAYAPYVREMNLWFSQAEKVEIIAPVNDGERNPILLKYDKSDLILNQIPGMNLLSTRSAVKLFFQLPIIIIKMLRAMYKADHIHIRSPGNIALIACFLQVLFPFKNKTAKYAGNWDPNSVQPWSYKWQKKILSNTFLTRKMKVLVYGNWPSQSKNVYSFFTATFTEDDKVMARQNFDYPFEFIFVGSLVSGKNPLYAIKLIESLRELGVPASLKIYGEGVLEKELKDYINKNNLASIISLEGNIVLNQLKKTYLESHFIILASQSEGWPKAIAEGMFYGCIPIATSVSCVPWMLDNGKRGVLVTEDIDQTTHCILNILNDKSKLQRMSKKAQNWSEQYTLEKFEHEIKKLLNPMEKLSIKSSFPFEKGGGVG